MTVNIVVFIDCYSRIIWLLLRTSSQKKTKQKAHAYFGRLVFSKFFRRENYAILKGVSKN